MLCSVCSPFSGHLYEKLTEKGLDGLTMTEDFCTKYVDECRDQISFEDDYCKAHTLDYSNEYWSYPYTAGECRAAAVVATEFGLDLGAAGTISLAERQCAEGNSEDKLVRVQDIPLNPIVEL